MNQKMTRLKIVGSMLLLFLLVLVAGCETYPSGVTPTPYTATPTPTPHPDPFINPFEYSFDFPRNPGNTDMWSLWEVNIVSTVVQASLFQWFEFAALFGCHAGCEDYEGAIGGIRTGEVQDIYTCQDAIERVYFNIPDMDTGWIEVQENLDGGLWHAVFSVSNYTEQHPYPYIFFKVESSFLVQGIRERITIPMVN